MQHHVGREEGVGQVMTTISLVVLEVPRRRQGGVLLELPRSRLRKAIAITKGSNSQVRLCGKTRVVGKI